VTPKEAVGAVVDGAPDALFVSALGTATSALRAVTDDGPHLYMGGAMGSALAVALGVSEACPARRVVAIVGDGELLMGAGSLWSLAATAPANLLVVILVDGHYSITGGQPLAVEGAFAEVARALGLVAQVTEDAAGITDAVRRAPGAAVLEIRYSDREWRGPSPFVDPPVVRWRFEAAATADADAGASLR
jgi:thiamine pyrophosphate-dependent acetolactate synthase large subunit-like protein